MNRKRFLSLFSGIGGFDQGLERAGMECAGQVEIEKQCVSVLTKHWPDVARYGDICEVKGSELPDFDLLCGGFPCQDLSTAGRRAGLAGARSGLFWEFARIIDEKHPRFVLIENVPGLLSSNRGRDMGVVVGTLADIGYGWAYRVLDAQYFGLAQRRKRVFIVGCLGDARSAAEILFEPESGDGNPAPSREARKIVAALSASGAGTGRTGNERTEAEMMVVSIDARNMTSNAEVTHTLSTGAGKQAVNHEVLIAQAFPDPAYAVAAGGGGSKFGNGRDGQDTFVVEGDPMEIVRRLTPVECERLQGFPDAWTAVGANGKPISDSVRYRILGNAVAVPVVEWIGRRIVGEMGQT